MALTDTRGRLFGRLNLVDALLAAFLLVALPAGYAAHLLLRAPEPTLRTVAPAAIEQGSTRLIEIDGDNLRPYMRVSFGDAQGPSFQFYGPRQAFVPAPPLEPGTYDVVLYDYMREVARLPKALTVTGPVRPPKVQLRLRGAYAGLTPAAASTLKVGEPLNATEGVIATALSLEAPRPAVARVRVSDALTVSVPMDGFVDVPATVLVTCPTSVGSGGAIECATSGTRFAPDMHLTIQGPAGRLLFRIEQFEGAEAAGGPSR